MEVYSVLCTVVVCLCCLTNGVLGGPEGSRGVDSAKGVASIVTGSNGQQDLQSVLYSIEERLRGLDLVYAPRYPPPSRHWDTEQNARRLDAVDARLARIEALLELRLDKIVEAVSGSHMRQSLSNDQLARKIETLHDRLSLRIDHTENRLDSGVAKLQASIARTERDSDSIEADVETQLNDMQKQFDNFEATQNVTLSMLSEISSNRCKRGELNDAENVVKDFTKQDVEQFASSMENVATKVNKMVTDFGHRTQTMESLVKNSMSLANATRRELQDGLRSLGLRIVHHGTKHNKEKENSFENGWDALAALMGREFGNLSDQLTKNYNTLVSAQDEFRNSCYRLQEREQHVADYISELLDKTLDITDNRSQEVAKKLGTLGEIVKSLGTEGRRLDSRDKNFDLMPQRLTEIDSVLQVIKGQVSELAALNAANEEAKENCLEASQAAEKIAIDSRQVALEETSRLVAEKVIAFINASRNEDRVFPEDEEFLHLEEYANRAEKESKSEALKRKSFLDIAEEDLGETLEYNVTEDAETKAPLTRSHRGKEIAGELGDFEFDKSHPEGEVDYDDDEEGTDDIVEPNEGSTKKLDGDKGKKNSTKGDPSIRVDILESDPTSLSAERNQGGVASTEMDSSRNRDEYVEGDKTNLTRDDIDPPKFSAYWHRLKNVNASDLSLGGKVDVKVSSKGQNGENVKVAAVGNVESTQGKTDGKDTISADNILRLDHHVNINHDDEEYDYGD